MPLGSKGRPTPKAPQNRKGAMPPARVVTHQLFSAEVRHLPDGAAELVFIEPDEVHRFPMNAEAVQGIGKELIAPRVEVADRMPTQPEGR